MLQNVTVTKLPQLGASTPPSRLRNPLILTQQDLPFHVPHDLLTGLPPLICENIVMTVPDASVASRVCIPARSGPMAGANIE